MEWIFPTNIKQGVTQRKSFIDSLEYGAWCQNVGVKDAVNDYGRYLGNRLIRRYYKSGCEEVKDLKNHKGVVTLLACRLSV